MKQPILSKTIQKDLIKNLQKLNHSELNTYRGWESHESGNKITNFKFDTLKISFVDLEPLEVLALDSFFRFLFTSSIGSDIDLTKLKDLEFNLIF